MRYAVKSAPPPSGDRNEFVMSDNSVDRVGDVVEASGWQLTNFKAHPIALFNHDPDQVIGKWKDVQVKGNQLRGRLELAAAGTSALVDTIRRLHEQDILRAVSVGFRALEKKKLTKEADDYFGPFRFTKSELLECSLVSVPANPHALATAKDLPRELIGEIFCKPATEDPPAFAVHHGKPAAKSLAHQGANMTTTSTVATRILNAQDNIKVLRDALNELLAKDEMTDEDAQRYDELPKQIEAAKAELEKHLAAERSMMDDIANNRTMATPRDDHNALIPYPEPKDAQPPLIAPPASPRVFAMPKKRPEYPELMLRALACWTRAEASHERDLGKMLREMYRGDEFTGQVLRAVTNPAATGTATWAAELTDTLTVGFLDRLIPTSIYNQLSAMGARYTFGAANQLKIPVRQSIATGSPGNLAGAWVGEGAAKPVRRASFATVSLVPNKLAVISTFTEEMATYSPYAIESIIRQGMADDTAIALDGYLLDAVASSATRPAGLLNGVSGITPSAATPATAAMVADLKALVAAMTALNGGRKVAILLNPAQALALGFAQTTTGDFLFTDRQEAGSKFGVSFIVSNSVPAARVIAVDADDFASATGDAPKFAVSTDATLHEEDTAPLPLSATGSPNTVAAPMRSLFQTDAVAVRMTLYVSWVMRRTGMVQTISPVIW